MKRMDRLLAILIALQRQPHTAKSLAEKLEVSKRTILRDMQALSEMGVPIGSATGPAGGFRLMEGFLLSPVQLDAQEALTALFALRAMTKLSDTPFNRARWTVMDKIKAILPEQTLNRIEPILDRMEMEVPKRHYKTPQLETLMAVIPEPRWLRVFYRSERYRRWLHIWPKRVYAAHGFWYCEAYLPTHGEDRVFRVDRFDAVEETEPPQPDIVPHPAEPLRKTEGDRAPVRIRARLTYRGMLKVEQDEHIGERVRAVADDLWEVDFLCPASEWQWAVRFFFCLGPDADVLEPDSLRGEIYRLAEQLCRRYGTAASDARSGDRLSDKDKEGEQGS